LILYNHNFIVGFIASGFMLNMSTAKPQLVHYPIILLTILYKSTFFKS